MNRATEITGSRICEYTHREYTHADRQTDRQTERERERERAADRYNDV